jgi:hypothetical protein
MALASHVPTEDGPYGQKCHHCRTRKALSAAAEPLESSLVTSVHQISRRRLCDHLRWSRTSATNGAPQLIALPRAYCQRVEHLIGGHRAAQLDGRPSVVGVLSSCVLSRLVVLPAQEAMKLDCHRIFRSTGRSLATLLTLLSCPARATGLGERGSSSATTAGSPVLVQVLGPGPQRVALSNIMPEVRQAWPGGATRTTP